MANLVDSIETLKKHVTLNSSFRIERLNPHIKRQERKHIKPLIGKALMDAIGEAPADSTRAELLELLQEASSNLAMFSFSNSGVVDISSAGFLKSSAEHAVPATWQDLKDMRRTFMRVGMEALDEALKLLEENEADFPEWKESEGYTNFTELFTRKTQDFQRYFNIENSRLTFLRLKPHLLKVENKYFRGLLGTETVNKIKNGSSPEEKNALRLAQAAQVPLAVSEMANEGSLMLTSQGILYEIEEIPGERKVTLDEREHYTLYAAKQEEGNEQLKSLVAYLTSKPDVFVDFASKEPNTIKSPVHNTKSIISF